MSLTAIYIRVSTIGQNEAGQKMEIDRWLNVNSVDRRKVRYYIDRESGDTLNRPEFEKLQQDIRDGLVHTVVVWKLDRLSRKLRDGLNTICDWCDRKLRVVSVTQAIDFGGTTGKMIAAILLGVGEIEQETRRERQAAGVAAAKEKGVYTGRKRGAVKAGVNPAEAIRLKELGLKQDQIAKSMGVSVRTVARYLKAS